MATRRMKKPSVKAGVADTYAAPGERIVEFSAPSGRGGLISVRDRGETTVVDVHRTDAGVEVRGGPVESSEERAAKFNVGNLLNDTFAFLKAGVEHYEKTAPMVSRHLDELYVRLIDREPVQWLEVVNVLALRDIHTLEWEHPNQAANEVYKLRHALGMDVTGWAGF